MKSSFHCLHRLTVFVGLLIAAVGAHGQGFDLGSNGSLGDMVVSQNTVMDLPPDGILHFKTLRVDAGATLSFRGNSNNTPAYLLSQGDVIINGVISVSGSPAISGDYNGGRGGPGGYAGGNGGIGTEVPPGDGYGPGGGRGGPHIFLTGAGSGSYGARHTSMPLSGATYGSPLLVPLAGGSGGGGHAGTGVAGFVGGGGGGGGAILIAANTQILLSGTVEANGGLGSGNWQMNSGSGGAIRLVAPKVAGRGRLNTDSPGSQGYGRTRVDALDRTELRLNLGQVPSVGGVITVFPPNLPHLDLTKVADTDIPLGSGPVSITLPFGSDTNRNVVVQASHFGAKVPIAVILSPDNGPRQVFDAEVDNTTANPASITVPVFFVPNVLTTVQVWTR